MIRLITFIFGAIALLSLDAQSQTIEQELVITHMNSAFAFYDSGDYQNALTDFLETGKLLENDTSKVNRDVYVLSLSMAVKCYNNLKLHNDAFVLSQKLLEGNLTEQERDVLKNLYVKNGYALAGTKYYNVGHYADARELLKRILPYANPEQRNKILLLFSMTWYKEAALYEVNQQYREALPCMIEARKGFHETNDTIHEVKSYFKIGTLLTRLNDYFGALESYQKAYQLASQKKYDKQLIEIRILNEQKQLSDLVGDTENAFKYDLMIDSLISVTNDTSVIIEGYKQKGEKAYNHESYDIALQYFKKSEQYAQMLGQEYNEAYSIYLSLCNVYKKMGQYGKAFEYAHKSIEEYIRHGGENDFHYQVLAEIYCHMKDTANCILYADSLVTVTSQYEEPKQRYLAHSLRARCHSAFKDYDQALADFKEADGILSTKYNETDEDRIMLLALMGAMENKLMNYDVSEHLYSKYAEQVKAKYGEKSINYINALNYLANAEGFAGHIEQGINDYDHSVNLAKTYIQERLPYLTTADRQGLWEPLSKMMCDMTPFAIQAGQQQSSFTESCYEGLVLSKGFLLSSERSTFDLIGSQGSERDLKDYATIALKMARIKEWEKDYAANADSILNLTNQINILEKNLMDNCRSFGDITSFMSIGYKKIQEELGEKDVIIDFTDYVTASRGRVYAAYLINRNQDHPLLKELFTESVIDSMQVPFKNKYYREPYASKLYHLLWEPFSKYVDEGATVYYVPSQFLFQLALESLPLEDGTLLGDHYNFIRLSSVREIVNVNPILSVNEEDKPSAVLYGGLKYSVSNEIMKQESSKYENLSIPYYAQRRDIARGDSVFKELPWAKVEVEVINEMLSAQHIAVKPYTGINGTEESFMAISGKTPCILHVATHGFYFSPKEAQDVDFLNGYQDAMMLSGLVMAGGDSAWQGKSVPKGVMDGILTAEEISRLDLNGVEIAVLSACQTGQGKATSEGLYGLQRAFKKAGVQTLIMSLWNVSDKVSCEFMIEFYNQLVNPKDSKDRWNKRKAFDGAKRSIRQKHDDPYCWAPFVMLD